jgi:hypothetical protein
LFYGMQLELQNVAPSIWGGAVLNRPLGAV